MGNVTLIISVPELAGQEFEVLVETRTVRAEPDVGFPEDYEEIEDITFECPLVQELYATGRIVLSKDQMQHISDEAQYCND